MVDRDDFFRILCALRYGPTECRHKKYIAQFHAVDDQESINKVIITSQVIYAGIATLMLLVIGGVAWAFPLIFDTGKYPVDDMRWIVVLTGLNFTFRLLGQTYSAAIVALNRFDISNGIAVTSQLAQALSVVGVLYFGYGLVGMAWANMAVGAVTNILLRCIAANKLLGGISYSLAYFDRDTYRMVFRYGGISFLTKFGNRVVGRMSILIIGAMLGPVIVAYYSIATALAWKGFEAVSASIRTVIFPMASRLDSQGRHETLREVLTVSSRVLLAFGLSIASIYWVMGRTIISVWIDPEYAAHCYPLLAVMIFSCILHSSNQGNISILRGMGRLGVMSKCAGLNAFFILCVGPIMTYFYGAIGMVFTGLVSNILRNGAILPYATCKVLDWPFRSYLRSVIPTAIVAAIPALILSVGIEYYFPAQRLRFLVPQLAFIMTVSAITIFFLCLDRERRTDIIRSMTKQRRSKKQPLADAPAQT